MKDGQNQVNLGASNQLRNLFKPGSWLTKIDFINHLVLLNNVLISVLAEKSGGKTSFSSLLLNNLDQQIKPVFISIHSPCDKGDILGDIAAQLHLNVDADTNVASIVGQINERKAHVLLVIDDAQNLPEELIKEFIVAIKGQNDFGFFHLCVISDYGLAATLNNLAAEQFNNLIHTIELGNLNESETRTYVLQRAMAARLITKPLTDSQYKQYYQMTKGNIARINANLDSFIFNCSKQKDNNKGASIKKAGIGALIVISASISLAYFMMSNKPNPYTKQQALEEVLNSTIPSIKSQKNEKTILAQELLQSSYIPYFHDSAVIQIVQNQTPKKENLDSSDEEYSLNTVALVDKVIVIPAVKKRILEHESLALNQVNHERQASKKTRISSTQTKNNSIVAKISRSSGFTIQLIASHKQSDVSRFKQNNKLYAATKIRYFKNQKGSWYILTMGDFTSRAQAQAKINKLPSSIARLKPWIRPLSGLTEKG